MPPSLALAPPPAAQAAGCGSSQALARHQDALSEEHRRELCPVQCQDAHLINLAREERPWSLTLCHGVPRPPPHTQPSLYLLSVPPSPEGQAPPCPMRGQAGAPCQVTAGEVLALPPSPTLGWGWRGPRRAFLHSTGHSPKDSLRNPSSPTSACPLRVGDPVCLPEHYCRCGYYQPSCCG